jgi:hypothetical protein
MRLTNGAFQTSGFRHFVDQPANKQPRGADSPISQLAASHPNRCGYPVAVFRPVETSFSLDWSPFQAYRESMPFCREPRIACRMTPSCRLGHP